MRTLKLMPDYFCFPLWEADPGEVGNVDPAGLPISQALRDRLLQWAGAFDAMLDMSDPAASRIAPEVAQAFEREGAALAQALRDELGPGFAITTRF